MASLRYLVLWRRWCGTLKRVVWYFEEGGVVHWSGWYCTLKRVMWYFEEGGVVLWRWWCGTLKRVMLYFEEGVVVLWRGRCDTLKRWWDTLKRYVNNYTFCTSSVCRMVSWKPLRVSRMYVANSMSVKKWTNKKYDRFFTPIFVQ